MKRMQLKMNHRMMNEPLKTYILILQTGLIFSYYRQFCCMYDDEIARMKGCSPMAC
jgi:hypothetical protein